MIKHERGHYMDRVKFLVLTYIKKSSWCEAFIDKIFNMQVILINYITRFQQEIVKWIWNTHVQIQYSRNQWKSSELSYNFTEKIQQNLSRPNLEINRGVSLDLQTQNNEKDLWSHLLAWNPFKRFYLLWSKYASPHFAMTTR